MSKACAADYLNSNTVVRVESRVVVQFSRWIPVVVRFGRLGDSGQTVKTMVTRIARVSSPRFDSIRVGDFSL